MDAEQKLKGRVSVERRMMATTAQCQQQRTGDGLAASLPVHFHGLVATEATKERRQSTWIAVLAAEHGHTRPDGPPSLPTPSAASATLKTNFSVVWLWFNTPGLDSPVPVAYFSGLFSLLSVFPRRYGFVGLAQPPSDSTHRLDWTKGLGSRASWGYDESELQSSSSPWRSLFNSMGIYTARCGSVKIHDSHRVTHRISNRWSWFFYSASIKSIK